MFKRYIPSFAAFICAFVLVRLLTLFLWPITDTTEGRYAEIAVQMIESGDWTIPYVYLQGALVPFLGKPPLHFWLTSFCVETFGINAFSPRLASALSAFVLLGVLYAVCRFKLGRDVARNAVIICASSGLFYFLSGAVGVDMTLSAGVAIALLCYFGWLKSERFWEEQAWSMGVFLGLAIGFMAKGPIAVATFGMPVFVWHCFFGQWKKVLLRHAWIPGMALFFALSVPWFVAAQNAMEAHGIDFFRYYFMEENIHRFTTADYFDPYGHGHVQIYGTAILYFLISLLPYSLFWGLLFRKIPKGTPLFTRCKNIFFQTPEEAFFFFAFFINVLFWCAGKQFLITYMLPMAAGFSVYFALCWKRRHPELVHLIPVTGFGLILLYFGASVIVGGLFEYVQPRQVFGQIYERVGDFDALNPQGKPWQIVIYDSRNYSAPYYYGHGKNRLKFTGPGIYSVPIPESDSAFTLPMRQHVALNSRQSVAKACRVYGEADGVLYAMASDHLAYACGLPPGSYMFTDVTLHKNFGFDPKNPDRLIQGPVDAPETLEVLFQCGDYIVLRPRGYTGTHAASYVE